MNLSTSKVMSIVPKSFIRTFSRQLLIAKKNSPHIFFVGGIGGVITSTVLACRSTLRLSETLTEIQEEVTTVKELHESISDEAYSTEDWYKDTIYVYGKSSIKLVKLYAPSIVVGVISVGALTGSHVQLTKRNNALMAAYALLHTAFEQYRARVREDYGYDKELDYYTGVRTQLSEDEKGKAIEVKSVDPNQLSVYARFFDEGSASWEKDPELNRLFVQCQQNHANNLLQARGHLFLNEVYDMLGIDRSQAGQVVGWVVPSENGDGYVSFGMFDSYSSRFINGVERSILLDFNVDGVIYDKL